MKILTTKELVLFLVYPWLHVGLCFLAAFMSVQAGSNYAEYMPTVVERLVAAFGTGLFRVLLIPWVLLDMIGYNLPTQNNLNFVWMYLTGILYATIFLLVHKSNKKQKTA